MRSDIISKSLAITFLVAAPLASAAPVKFDGAELSLRGLGSHLNFVRSILSLGARAESPAKADDNGDADDEFAFDSYIDAVSVKARDAPAEAGVEDGSGDYDETSVSFEERDVPDEGDANGSLEYDEVDDLNEVLYG